MAIERAGKLAREGITSPTVPDGDARDLAQRAAEIEWYHTIELMPGVVTPGWFDTRGIVERVGFPGDLAGKRCLDVATFDGFWAFTMERHGAAEVLAIDVPDPNKWDWPANTDQAARDEISRRRPGAGFALAAEAIGSRVDRREISVYDLDPGTVGTFDFVYVGSLLLHLRDPVGALMKVRQVCTGTLLLVDAIHVSPLIGWGPAATLDGRGRPWWWKPNLRGLERMVGAAGFLVQPPVRRVRIPAGEAQGKPALSAKALTQRAGRETVTIVRFGDPHAAILATPRPTSG